MSDGGDFDFQLYRYVPSLAAAIVAAAVFGLLTVGHTWRMVVTRTWFCLPFVIGGIFELIGYIGRCFSHFDKEALGPFVIQSLLILLGPALYAASIYMTLGRIIRAVHGESFSVIPITWQTRLFVLGDVASFLTQMVGGGIQAAGSLSLLHAGEKIITVGLLIQIAFFGFFTVTSVVFNLRIRQHPTHKSLERVVPWQQLLVMLYAVSTLILVRSIFRVVEYIQGNAGYLLRTEYWLYIFDALLMALTMAIFLVYHPSLLNPALQQSPIVLRSRDGE